LDRTCKIRARRTVSWLCAAAKRKKFYGWILNCRRRASDCHIGTRFCKGHNSAADQVKQAIADGYKRLLKPSMETEVRLFTKKKADEEAIRVFAENARQLLLGAPLGQKRVMAIDPGFRTGCKLVCLDEQGKLLENAIYPHTGAGQWHVRPKKQFSICFKNIIYKLLPLVTVLPAAKPRYLYVQPELARC
jgi:hypothetical protein